MNGQATGPYDLATLKNMTLAGQFTANSLVWQQGMPAWDKAGNIEELRKLFSSVPPTPPIG